MYPPNYHIFLFIAQSRQQQKQIRQKYFFTMLQEFLYFDYTNYLYLHNTMESQNHDDESRYKVQQCPPHQKQESRLQNQPQHKVIQEVKEYICYAQLSQKQQIINKLNQQLKEKEKQISSIREEQQQLRQTMEQKILEEKGKLIKQFCQREKKIQEQVKYIKQVEKTRQKTFEQICRFVKETNGTIQTQRQQILDKIEESRFKNDRDVQSQRQSSSQMIQNNLLKEELQSTKETNKKMETKVRQAEQQLVRLKAKDKNRQLEKKYKNCQVEQKYKFLQQSLNTKIKLMEQNNQNQVKQLKREIKEIRDKKQNQEKQLIQKIKSQKQLSKTLLKIQNQKEGLQKQQKQSKLKINQLTEDISQLRNKLQIKFQYQHQINRLKQELTRKEQLLTKSTQIYTKKSSDLEIAYDNFKNREKENYENEKCSFQTQHAIKINQLNKVISDLTREKENQKQANTNFQQTFKQQRESFTSKIAIHEQQMRKFKNFIYQLRNILSAEKRISNKIEDPQLLLDNLKLMMSNFKTQVTTSKSQEQKALQLVVNYKQICQINKFLIAKVIQNVKNITNFKKVKEQSENKSHLGQLINTLADKIKDLIVQKQNILNQKLHLIQTYKNENKQLGKELDISRNILAQLNKKQISLQIQNRTLKLNAESNNIQREKISEKKQQCLTLELQLKENKQKLDNLKEDIEQQKRINKQLRIQLQISQNKNQSDQLSRRISQLTKYLQTINKDLKIQKQLTKSLNNKLDEHKEKNKTLQLNITLLEKEINKQKREMKQRQQILKKQLDDTIQEISTTLEEVTGSQPENKDTNGIVQMIRKNGCSSNQNTSFSVSEILQKLPKQRIFLMQECCKFIGAKYISTKMSFKYDQNCKNFSSYLPTITNKFLFAVILKTKKNVVFGLISQFIGCQSKSFAFNLSTRKIMNKSQKSKLSSTSFQSSMLKFGNDQIVIKNNSSLEIKINTMIIGERYFDFSKEDLVGKGENGDTVQLQALQIHKIIAVV